MSETNTLTSEEVMAEEIVSLLCSKQMPYREALVALSIAQRCVSTVADDELRHLPIAKKIVVKGMIADLTVPRLLLADGQGG